MIGDDRKETPRTIVRRHRAPVVGERRPRTIVKRDGGLPRGGAGSGAARGWPSVSRGWLLGGVVVAFVLVLAAGAWAAWQSSLFEISRVAVTGTRYVEKDEVVQRANLIGAHMVTADLGAAQARIAALPLVASVTVSRDWPNGVRVVVREREPWGTWEQGGVAYTIDRDGVVLGPIPAPRGAPVIRSAQPGSLQQGDRVDYQAVEAAVAIYDQLPGRLSTGVREVAFVPGKGVQVTTSDGQVALFGDSSAIPYKLAVWAAVQAKAQSEHISYTTIDLRFGNRPVVQ